ncbi:MAG: hypothetical protein HPY68_09060 [Candidatus Atribacteria bacterium]|nr:hypothetical protein [Candidatus Atribacteria bacterium]
MVKKESLALLLGYLNNQMEIFHRLLALIAKKDTATEEETVYLGYLLHNLYCALEDLFREIAKTFENTVDEDPLRFHRQLLKRMSLEVPRIRPRVITPESYEILDELRGFRHIFRHSYAYSLSPEKVLHLKGKICARWSEIEKDLLRWKSFLEQHIEE